MFQIHFRLDRKRDKGFKNHVINYQNNGVRESNKLAALAPSSGESFSLSTGAVEILILTVLRVPLQYRKWKNTADSHDCFTVTFRAPASTLSSTKVFIGNVGIQLSVSETSIIL